ncbi:peptidase [Sporanaerobium hydrogeniformans]|uniref:Peptidase n=1 Tax=Sporanaerobium hydrogeniformans TaxID=3072179 RepID=A0AC61DAF7_9FIRM|nr:head maturation protease, ClpP-related [Sporanaerobium hydrogeniformans]PHV69773.1 peptidase [Sporanaerobium hydrogeniformans]
MAKVKIKGAIINNSQKWIYDWFEMDSTCPNDVVKALAMDNEDVEVEINSGGGDIFAGSEIYTILRAEKRSKKCYIVGLAASAASVIAMACETYMSPTSMMMVHNVSTYADGDCNVMQHTADTLKSANQSIAQSYVDKTGMSMEDALEMMNKETWLTAQQAKEKKLVDGIMFENSQPASLVASFENGMIPFSIIKKMQNERLDNFTTEKRQKLNNKYKFLKMKGEI